MGSRLRVPLLRGLRVRGREMMGIILMRLMLDRTSRMEMLGRRRSHQKSVHLARPLVKPRVSLPRR